MIEIRMIDKASAADIRLPNEPFALTGRMIPSLQNGVWDHRIVAFAPADVGEMCFPDEDYDFDAMSRDCVFVGAYDGDVCVGLAIWQKEWHRYLYLYDLKVNRACRGQGVGTKLIAHGLALARTLGKRGLYTVGQDNNLNACRFYLKQGFRIGGFNNRVYDGTSQAGKADIYFYLDLAPDTELPSDQAEKGTE